MEDGGDGADHPAALQGILRKLSAGLDNLIAGTSFPRMRSLLADLKSGDDSRTIGALTELCNMLSMATDESMIAFSVDQFVPVLVDLLGQDSNPNIMLLAARSLTNLIEVLPAAGEVLVHRGAVPILVSKLLCIEYMDVAEQALECLERLSRDNAQPILQSGGLTAALAFLDFFSTGLQCVSLNLAASICHSMQPSGCDLVVETIPVLTNVLTYQDTRIVDSAISCFHSLSRAFKNSEADLATIAAHGLLNRVLEVVAARESVSGAAHRPVNFTMLIQILAIHCRHSADTVQTVINSGMIDMLHSVLSASGRMQTNEDEDEQIKIAARPSEQLAEILQLCYELLPPLPPAMARFVWSEAELAEMDLEQYEGGMHPKTLLFHKCPSLLITYGDSLFGLLLQVPHPCSLSASLTSEPLSSSLGAIVLRGLCASLNAHLITGVWQVYAESMALNVRHRALASISAIIYHMTAPMLDSLLARKPFSGFCADLLASGEAPIAMTALQMCSVLMDRLPVVFHHQLLREGVIDAIHTMRSLEGVAKLFTCDEEHSARLCECASQFWSTHVLPSLDSSGSITKTLALSKLLVLSEKLAEFGALGADSGGEASAVLTEIFQLLVVGEGVSVFEFQGSKLTEALIAFLDPMHDDLNQRIRCVLDCAIRTNNSDPANGLQRVASASSTQPITVLVRLLSGCVDKLEHFAVMLHSSVTNLAVGLKVLTQPFKLCLKRDPSESLSSSLQDYSSNVVLIEPLATVTAVEEFLWAKVHEADVDEMDEMPDGAAPRGERLTLRMRGLQLDQKSTIFQAIYEATSGENCVEGDEECNISHKVWEQVHIITYSLHKPEDTSSPMSPVWTKLAAEQSNQEVHTNMAALAAQVMLKVSEASDNTKEWGFLSTALHLLSTLNWVCSLWNHFCSPETLQQIVPTGIDTRGGDSSALLASHCFVSAKLTNKLMRQLQDPLVLCSGGLPPWCLTLVSNAGFVLPFECRRLFFQYTSLGISRALHIMQHRAQQSENGQASPTRGANLSNNSEFRLGRIQRQKARVHRQRILMSAVKVLELCTGHKAVLEVEFSGEAGTGTGPTLEFFTLVSREVQRKDLNMWYQSETSKQLAPRTQESELVFTPPAEDVHMHNVHRIAVLHCPECNHTVFPVSPHSGELLTISIDDGQAAACTQEPGEPQVRADSIPCASCACEQPMSLLWWIVFDDEAQYLAKAFPSGVATLQHMVLQCPCCHSVNFPGTEHTLTINRNGKMYSASGRRLHEHEYRAVTQHASSLCENVPLKQVPVALSQEVCLLLSVSPLYWSLCLPSHMQLTLLFCSTHPAGFSLHDSSLSAVRSV